MNLQRKAHLEQALDRILQILITQYQPEKIILFGSMATGNVTDWSDLDLVVIKETSLPFLQRPVSVNYFVYTPQEFEQMVAENHHFICNEVLAKGKVLYERQLENTRIHWEYRGLTDPAQG
jgi:predicted nucleotidyltransferase